MTHTYTYGQTVISVTKRDYPQLCIIVMPFQLLPSEMETLASDFGCNVAVISGINWDDDLTPWAETLGKDGSRQFKGFADRFLENLTDTFVPQIERIIGHESSSRTLIGVSLAGLFAVWQMTRAKLFDNIGSISGSFWYPGFTEYLDAEKDNIFGKQVYLSLGEAEASNKNTVYGDVMSATRQVESILESKGVDVRFEMTSGGHNAPIYPRIENAMKVLFCNTAQIM